VGEGNTRKNLTSLASYIKKEKRLGENSQFPPDLSIQHKTP